MSDEVIELIPEEISRLDKVKAHVGRHKVAYSIGTVGAVVVIAGVSFYVGTRFGSTRILSPSIVGDYNTLEQLTTINVHNAGRLHKIVRRVGTTEIWETVDDLAAEIAAEHGIKFESARVLLSKHLNGKTDHVYGKVYEILGIGTRTKG